MENSMYKALFVGEERSQKAIEMNVRWEDGRLAGKQLFDALRTNGYEPSDYTFSDEWINGECEDIDFVLKKWTRERLEDNVFRQIRDEIGHLL